MINFFSKFSFVLSQKRHFFAKIFGENILEIITSVPGLVLQRIPTSCEAKYSIPMIAK
jgi:hypothetical protein